MEMKLKDLITHKNNVINLISSVKIFIICHNLMVHNLYKNLDYAYLQFSLLRHADTKFANSQSSLVHISNFRLFTVSYL